MEHPERAQRDSFAWSPPTDQLDFSSGSRGWFDPVDERTRDRRRIRACLLAFSMLGFALILASVSTGGSVLFMLRGIPGGFLPDSWKFIESTLIVWLSFVGTCLLWGRWRDSSWQRRSGLLVLMGFVDIVLWSLDYAVPLGLSEREMGHDWFRQNLGHALGWAEISLMASLSADVAAHLGMPQAQEFARGARSLASVGATVFLFVFFFQTRWKPPIWPLRINPFNLFMEVMLLARGEIILYVICLVQVTALILAACYACTLALRTMLREDRSHDLLGLPSETAWDEFHKNRPQDSL